MNTISTSRQYKAFISYCHADNRDEGRTWASWLHESLESYEIPSRILKQLRDRGTVLDSMFPVFRDEVELSAGPNLSESILSALRNSECLIVLCSPRAAKSHYVEQEIRAFKEMGKANRIIGLLISGEPNAKGMNSEMECLPKALRFGAIDKNGVWDWDAKAEFEPICADVRPEGAETEGWTSSGRYRAELLERQIAAPIARRVSREYAQRLELARLKVIGGVLKVELGELKRHNDKFRIERLKRALAVVGSLFICLLIATIWAVVAQQQAIRQSRAADHANGQANHLINEMLYSLGAKLKPLGQLKLLDQVSATAETYFVNLPTHLNRQEVQQNKAAMWISRGDVLEELDDPSSLQSYEFAFDTLKAIGGGKSKSFEVRRLYSICLERMADLCEDTNPQRAISHSVEATGILLQLIAESPSESQLKKLLVDLGQIYERHGDILEDSSGELAQAEVLFNKSLDVRRKAYELDGNDPRIRRDYGVAFARLGDTYRASNQLSKAEQAFSEGLRLRRELVENHPLNTAWQSEISRSYASLSDVFEVQNRIPEAIKSQQASLQIRKVLADFDPSNAKWKGDFLRSLQALSRLQRTAGNGEAALAEAEEVLLLYEQVMKTMPEPKVVLDFVEALRLRTLLAMELNRQDAMTTLQRAKSVLNTLSKSTKGNAKIEFAQCKLLVLEGDIASNAADRDRARKCYQLAIELLLSQDQGNSLVLDERHFAEEKLKTLNAKSP